MNRNFKFVQADYLNALPSNRQFSNAGICAVLSASWIRMMRDSKNEGTGARKAELELIAKGGGSVAQLAYTKAWDSQNDVVQNNRFVVRLAGDSDVAGSAQGGPGILSGQVSSYVASKRRRGVHFNFGFSAGGHAVAFWRSAGHTYFFDPNYGEYKGNKGEIAGWFGNFMAQNYGSGNGIPWWYLLLLQKVTSVKDGVRVI